MQDKEKECVMVKKIIPSICLLLSISLSLNSIGNAEMMDQDKKEKTSISEKQAKDIALQKIKGKVLAVEREKEDGKIYYEVKILTSEKVLFEVEIDARTGKIVEVEKEGKIKDK